MIEPETTDYDGAWKVTLERFFPDFLSLALPDVAALVDLTAPPRFLDTELHEVVREAEVGRLWVDKLVEVRRKDGAALWLVIHVEVQSQRDETLSLRMFRYCYRLLDRFDRPLISLAVLADPHPRWKPTVHSWEHHGCELRFQYRVCKLSELDLGPWLAAGNPVAQIIQAHRCAQATAGDPAGRRQGKLAVVRQLWASGRPEDEVWEVFRLINWLLALSAQEEVLLREDLKAEGKETNMSYVTMYDRVVREEGWQAGLQEGRQEGRKQALRELILEQLVERFGSVPEGLGAALEQLEDEAQLRALVRTAAKVPVLADLPLPMGV